MAATTHTITGSRFLRPELSRFINRVAQARPQISRFVKGAAATMPPTPDVFASRFLAKRRPCRSKPSPHRPWRAAPASCHQNSQPLHSSGCPRAPADYHPLLKNMAALMPPIPAFFSSRFFSKPRAPPRHLRPHWPNGKPKPRPLTPITFTATARAVLSFCF